MIKNGQHECECGSKIFTVCGECTRSKLLFNENQQVMCVKCGKRYKAITGEETKECYISYSHENGFKNE